MSYVLKDNDKKYLISYMSYETEGTTEEKIRLSNTCVATITFYDTKNIGNFYGNVFAQKFEAMTKLLLNFLYKDDDDCDEGEFEVVLDDVERIRSLLENKYKRFLEIKEYDDYIHKLAFIDNQLKAKYAVMNYRARIAEELEQLEFENRSR